MALLEYCKYLNFVLMFCFHLLICFITSLMNMHVIFCLVGGLGHYTMQAK